MMLRSSIELTPNPLHQGSRNRTGDQVERQFEHPLLALLGDCRLLWRPSLADVATATDKSRYARTLTFSESLRDFDAKPTRLGSGVAVRFNGTDEEADTPDVDGLSFGDGAVDQPFSVVALVKPDSIAAERTILARWDENSGGQSREFRFYHTGAGFPVIELYDESANAYIGRQDQTALSTSAYSLLVTTYDGSGASTGVAIYVDAALVDDADSVSGSYTAMENLGVVTGLAHKLDTSGAAANFFDGKMALVALVAKELSPDEVWAVKSLANSFFGLSL